MNHKRIETVKATGLTSSYRKKHHPNTRWSVDVFKENGYITPDMFDALKELNNLVNSKGGDLYIIDLYRSFEAQEEARIKFTTGVKKDFVAKPGESFHNCGRAVDISVKELNFSNVDKDDWLSTLWNLAKPLGFHPIIAIPDIDASESWHFDFPGTDWEDAYNKLRYKESAKCCALDIGMWDPKEDSDKTEKMFIQAQCIRLGHYSVGQVDGVIGSKTKKVLDILGVSSLELTAMAKALSKKTH